MNPESTNFDQLQSASAALGATNSCGSLLFSPPLPCGFDDFGLDVLRCDAKPIHTAASFENNKRAFVIVHSLFKTKRLNFGRSLPKEWDVARPTWTVENEEVCPGNMDVQVDFLPAFARSSGIPLPPTLAFNSRQGSLVFVFSNQAPVFAKKLSSAPADPQQVDQYQKLSVKVACFFREFAAAVDPNAFPWSHSPGLAGVLAATRASFDKTGGTAQRLPEAAPHMTAPPSGVSFKP